MRLTECDEERELLKHQDLNFDGYEDVELLQSYVPHLGKSLFCIYVWNVKAGQFSAAPEIPNINPVAHPGTRTLSVHEDFSGGVFTDSTYKWSGSNFCSFTAVLTLSRVFWAVATALVFPVIFLEAGVWANDAIGVNPAATFLGIG